MTVEIRAYLSLNLLYSAPHLAPLAAEREARDGLPAMDQRHRAYVLSTIVTAMTFLDAAINEVYQDAADGPEMSYSRVMTDRDRERFAGLWRAMDSGSRLRTLDRYEMALLLAEKEPLDRGASPFQDLAVLAQLRNWIVHYRPEQVGHHLDEPKFVITLRHRFPDNRLMSGQGNPWFPEHALGAGCANWAIRSARAFVDECFNRLDLEPVYRLVDTEQPPPESLTSTA